jgi:hypothetical protein
VMMHSLSEFFIPYMGCRHIDRLAGEAKCHFFGVKTFPAPLAPCY